MTAYAASIYIAYLSETEKISYVFGFLLFLPIWISSYWFSTFFMQLIEVKKGKKTIHLLDKSSTKILNGISTAISTLLLVYWIYIYIFKIMDTGGIPLLNKLK